MTTHTRSELASKLHELKGIWKRSSSSRKKNAPHKYVGAVYDFYRDLRSERIASKTAARISDLADLPPQPNRHPVRSIIDATCKADEKSRSRMARATRYAYSQNWDENIRTRLKEAGGIAGCADKFAEMNKNKQSKA